MIVVQTNRGLVLPLKTRSANQSQANINNNFDYSTIYTGTYQAKRTEHMVKQSKLNCKLNCSQPCGGYRVGDSYFLSIWAQTVLEKSVRESGESVKLKKVSIVEQGESKTSFETLFGRWEDVNGAGVCVHLCKRDICKTRPASFNLLYMCGC